MANEGVFGAIVWPCYVGALNIFGAEPGDDYVRGQIFWQPDEKLKVHGHARILVPAGYYTHLTYYHSQKGPLMVGHQVLSHPFDLRVAGVIDVADITEKDFTQLPTPRGFRLPLPVLA